MHKALGILWLLFALIFSVLAYRQYNAAQQMTPHFEANLGSGNATIIMGGMDINQTIRDFTAAFNGYIDQQNTSNHDENMLAFWGFVAALLTAIVSAGAEFFPNRA